MNIEIPGTGITMDRDELLDIMSYAADMQARSGLSPLGKELFSAILEAMEENPDRSIASVMGEELDNIMLLSEFDQWILRSWWARMTLIQDARTFTG